jgi:MFS family permease
MRGAFTTPGFRRLYAGLTTSMFGDMLMLIVLSMWVKSLTGSNGAAGLTFLWLTLPSFAAPLFGYVIDRVERRRFLIVGNLASALVVLPLLLVHDAGGVWLIYLVAFLYGVSFATLPAALNGLMKDMLAEEVLVEANAMLSVTREAWRLVGPLLGAGLFAWTGGGVVALIDAATFVVAGLTIVTIRVHETPAEPAEHHFWREVGAGLAHIRGLPVLLHTTIALGLCLLVLGFSESAVYAIMDAFHKPVEFVGPTLTVQGVGAVVGGLISTRVIRRLGEPRTIVVGLVAMAASFAVVAVATQLWLMLAGVAALGFSLPLLIVAYNTLLQKRTPARLMGRVSTTTDVLLTTPQALSIGTGALLVTIFDYRILFWIMTAGTLVGTAYLLVTLRGRLVEPPSQQPEEVVRSEVLPIPGTVLPDLPVE